VCKALFHYLKTNGTRLSLDHFFLQAYNTEVIMRFTVGVLGYDFNNFSAEYLITFRASVTGRLKNQVKSNSPYNAYFMPKLETFNPALFARNVRDEIAMYLKQVKEPTA